MFKYSNSPFKEIRPYYSVISKYDKNLIAETFYILRDENIKCSILIITNVYSMGIDSLNLKLII